MRLSFRLVALLPFALAACTASTSKTPDAIPTGPLPTGGGTNADCPSASYLLPLTLLSSDGGTIRNVLSDGTTLIVVAQTGIFSMPKAGGTLTALVGSVGSGLPNFQIMGIVSVIGPTIYYTLDGSLMSVPKTGGSPTTIAPLPSTYSNLTIDASGVYYVTGDSLSKPPVPYALQLLPLTGGSPTQVTSLPGELSQIAVDSGFVYLEDKTSHAIARVATTGGTPASLGVTGVSALIGSGSTMAFDATDLYYATTDGVSRVAKDGSGTAQPVTSFTASWLAIDHGTAYGQGIEILPDHDVPSAAWKTPVTGGTPTILTCAPQGTTIQGFGLDDTSVYVGVTESATHKAGILVVAK